MKITDCENFLNPLIENINENLILETYVNDDSEGDSSGDVTFTITDEETQNYRSFELIESQDCCGMVILSNPTSFSYTSEYNDELFKLIGKLARSLNFGCIIYTCPVTYMTEEYLRLFETTGWKKVNEWKNPKTNNDLVTYMLNL